MYARMLHLKSKAGKSTNLRKTILEQALPTLKKQPGFVDAIVLTSETENGYLLGISFWDSKQDADRFGEGPGRQIRDLMRPLLEADPMLQGFDVAGSTLRHIAGERAA